MNNIIKIFFDLEKEIWKYVGKNSVVYSGLEDHTDCYWKIDSDRDGLLWDYEEPKDFNYAADIWHGAIFRGEEYSIVVVSDGQGYRTCPFILSNSMEVK